MKNLAVCPLFNEGQVFYADWAKPDGFCDEAWKAIYQYVFALAHGADKELFYYKDWMPMNFLISRLFFNFRFLD